MTESQIQKDVLDYLKTVPQLKVWRTNAGRIKGGPIMAPKGCPDIIGYVKGQYAGRFIGIEIKQLGKNLTRTQKDWRNEMQRSCCNYWVVRSVEDMKDVVERFYT